MRNWCIAVTLVVLGCSSERPAGEKDTAGAPPAAGQAAAPAAGQAAAPAAPEVQGRAIPIEVTKRGYTPSTVEVKANEQVTLVFTRTENTECGAEIMIPSMRIKKPLPLGQPVAIPLKVEQPGEVVFACGMDMMHGIVTVQN